MMSPSLTIPRSPCRASTLCRRTAVEPVLVSVAAIFCPTLPDLPTPTTTIFARCRSAWTINSTARSNAWSSCARTALSPASSMSKTSRARFRWLMRREGASAKNGIQCRTPLLGVRVRAEHFDEAALLFQLTDGFGNFVVAGMAVAVDEEEILPGFSFAGARFNFRHVDAVTAKGGERAMQRAHLVHQADHDAGAIVAGGRAALAAQHQEARRVGGIVLDVVFQHAQPVFFRSELAGDGRRALFFRRQLSRTRVGGGLDDFDAREVVLHPGAALGQRLRVGEQLLELRFPRIAEQAMLHAQDDLRNNLQIAIHEHVEGVCDDAFG